jgi:hypothetical protein
LAWANGRGKRLIKEEKQKISPPRKKRPGPIINGWTDLREASFGWLHTDSKEADPMHGFKRSFNIQLQNMPSVFLYYM